jgi:hypothetical protein
MKNIKTYHSETQLSCHIPAPPELLHELLQAFSSSSCTLVLCWFSASILLLFKTHSIFTPGSYFTIYQTKMVYDVPCWHQIFVVMSNLLYWKQTNLYKHLHKVSLNKEFELVLLWVLCNFLHTETNISPKKLLQTEDKTKKIYY